MNKNVLYTQCMKNIFINKFFRTISEVAGAPLSNETIKNVFAMTDSGERWAGSDVNHMWVGFRFT
jgi:hypothetical protein